MTQKPSPDEIIAKIKFDAQNLVPVVVVDTTSRAVIMQAFANEAAVRQTLATKMATYWSRSRREIWVKGATSGHIQPIIKIFIDCDGDCLIYEVAQVGPACHTGATSCFFTEIVI